METVHMKSPAGEIKAVAADEKTLVPLMNQGWTQHFPATEETPAVEEK